MKTNKLKAISIAVCCLVASLCSETLCMEGKELEKIENYVRCYSKESITDVDLAIGNDTFKNPMGLVFSKQNNGDYAQISFLSGKQWNGLIKKDEIQSIKDQDILIWVNIYPFDIKIKDPVKF